MIAKIDKFIFGDATAYTYLPKLISPLSSSKINQKPIVKNYHTKKSFDYTKMETSYSAHFVGNDIGELCLKSPCIAIGYPFYYPKVRRKKKRRKPRMSLVLIFQIKRS